VVKFFHRRRARYSKLRFLNSGGGFKKKREEKGEGR